MDGSRITRRRSPIRLRACDNPIVVTVSPFPEWGGIHARDEHERASWSFDAIGTPSMRSWPCGDRMGSEPLPRSLESSNLMDGSQLCLTCDFKVSGHDEGQFLTGSSSLQRCRTVSLGLGLLSHRAEVVREVDSCHAGDVMEGGRLW